MIFSKVLFLTLLLWIIPLQVDGGGLWSDSGGNWEGKVIDKIQFDETGPYSASELHTLIRIEPGNLYQSRLIRDAVKQLYETGQFKSVWVTISPIDEKRISLRIHWVQPLLLSSIKTENNRLFSTQELIEIMGTKLGEGFSQEAFEEGIANIKTRYQREGYFQIKVTSKFQTVQGQAHRVETFLDVNEGARTRIHKVSFLGETIFSNWRLRLKIYSNKGEYYRFDEFKEDIQRLKQFYEDKGYFRVVVGPGAVNYLKKTNEVDVTIGIQAFQRIKLFFEGGALYPRKKLEPLLLIKKERSADLGVLEGSARQITRFYLSEGYPFAKTSVRLKTFPAENRVEAYFTVESGPRVVVKAVQFSGHVAFSREVLLKQIMLKKSGRFIRTYYTKEALEKDVTALTIYYRGEGFQSVNVTPELRFDDARSSVTVRFNVDEGPRIRIRTIEIKGNKALSSDVLSNALPLLPQTPFTPAKVKQGKGALLSTYAKNGFINADVSPELHLSLDQTDAILTYHIAEGEQIHFGHIDLEGNQKTRDDVIMRELVIKPGAPYDPGAVLESQRNLYRTGLFSSVRFDPVKGESTSDSLGKPITLDIKLSQDINLTVEEKPRMSLEFGFGFSDRERLRGFIAASHQNLGGAGRSITARIEGGRFEEKYFLIYRQPWVFDKSITARISASYLAVQEVSFDLKTFSVVLALDKAFSARLRGSLPYQIERKQTTNVASSADLTPQDEDLFTIGSFNPSLIYDTRDDPFNPRSGSVSSIVIRDAAKILGSEVQLVKMVFQRRSYHAISSKLVFAFSARAGVAEQFGETTIIPLSERFFLGGRNTVRGYNEDKLGVAGQTIVNGIPTGGNAMFVLNEELRYSLPLSFGLVLFLDHGNVWSRYKNITLSEVKSTVGSGLRYNTPIGPLRLDWGFKLDREGNESPSAFHFTLGHSF